MRIRASTEYALQTVMHLAVADAGTTTARQIAADQDIPPRFLTPVITQLRRAGILASRGGRGGYQLAIPADLLSVAEVVRAVDHGEDGRVAVSRCSPDPTLERLWLALDMEIHDFLDGVTVADLVAGELPGWARQLAARGQAR